MPQLVGEAHQALRLAEPLGVRGTEVAQDVRLGVGALLVPDDHDRHGRRGSAGPPTMAGSSPNARSPCELVEALEDARHQVERARALRVPGELDAPPGARRPPRRSARLAATAPSIAARASSTLLIGRSAAWAPSRGRCRFPRSAASGSTSMPIVSLTAPPRRSARPESAPIGPRARSDSRRALVPAATGSRRSSRASVGAQLGARHDAVDEAVRQQELGGLEALGQLLPDGVRTRRARRRSR